MTKALIWIGLFIGSTVGGLIPTLWGDDFFSLASLGLSTLGAVAGIFGGYRLGQNIS